MFSSGQGMALINANDRLVGHSSDCDIFEPVYLSRLSYLVIVYLKILCPTMGGLIFGRGSYSKVYG